MSLLRSIRPVFVDLRDLAIDVLGFARSSFRCRTALIAENLFLRKQLAFYQERQLVSGRNRESTDRCAQRCADPLSLLLPQLRVGDLQLVRDQVAESADCVGIFAG